MKLINITLSSTPTEDKTYTYKVEINLNGNWNTAHIGKFFCQSGQTTVQLDLDDVLINHQFQGVQSIKPVANAMYNAYMPSVADTGVLNECWCNDISVVSLDNPMSFETVTKSFFFLPTQIFGYEGIDLSVGGYIPAQYHYLLPTLPANKPDGFVFSTLFYVNIGGRTIDVKKNTTTTDTIDTTANTAYHVKLDYNAGESCTFYVGGIPVAKTESSCNSPYYLVWIQNDGALNCQPFTNTSKFSISYTNKTAVDVRNAEWKITATGEAKWALKSRTVNENEYKDFSSLFTSPYILLLDMNTGRMHYVNVSKTTYEQKHKTRQDRKPIYFELEVKSADKIRV
jgi:hypothetical protein